jgi:hypothetical protein
LETGQLLGPLWLTERKEKQGQQEQRVHRVLLDQRVKRGLLEQLDQQDLLVLLERKVFKEFKE